VGNLPYSFVDTCKTEILLVRLLQTHTDEGDVNGYGVPVVAYPGRKSTKVKYYGTLMATK